MELTKISEWFDGTSDYLPQVGSDVILMPLFVKDDWLVLRFLDHLGIGINLELCSSDLHRIICFIKAQRALKGLTTGKGIILSEGEQPPADGKNSALTEWFIDDGIYRPQYESAVYLTEILCKLDGDDRLSADFPDPENEEKESYLLHFQSLTGNALEILLSRIDADRIIYFEESRQSLRLRELL